MHPSRFVKHESNPIVPQLPLFSLEKQLSHFIIIYIFDFQIIFIFLFVNCILNILKSDLPFFPAFFFRLRIIFFWSSRLHVIVGFGVPSALHCKLALWFSLIVTDDGELSSSMIFGGTWNKKWYHYWILMVPSWKKNFKVL